MIKRYFTLAIFSLATIISLSLPVSAQEDSDPVKQQLLKKLLSLMNLKGLSDKSMNLGYEQFRTEMIAALMDRYYYHPSLTATRRKEVKQYIEEFCSHLVNKMEGRMRQKVDLVALNQKVITSVYEKKFSVNEIKELIAFYESPIGQKWAQVLPQIQNEVSIKVDKELAPIVDQLISEFTQDKEDLDAIERLRVFAAPPPPPAPSPAPAKNKKHSRKRK